MMKYTPPTRMEKNPMTRAARAAPTAGHTSDARSPGWALRARAATYPPRPKKAEWPKDTMPARPMRRSRLMAKMPQIKISWSSLTG